MRGQGACARSFVKALTNGLLGFRYTRCVRRHGASGGTEMESHMNSIRKLALAGLTLAGIVASSAAFATSYYECYWAWVWTDYGYDLQYVCY
jgi:hypothetical protein